MLEELLKRSQHAGVTPVVRQLRRFDMAELLNVKEGAQELRVSIHTMRWWIYQRRLPHVKLGRRVLLKREDLENFIERNVVKAKKE
jgi:excisionase family DNA binding protein